MFGVLQGFTEFLPISASAHHVLVPYLLGWPQPSGVFLGALSLGTLLALLVYFRHDWASIISSFLQVIIFRKRPMTLDERLPLFIFLATLPVAASYYYFQDKLTLFTPSPLWVAISLCVCSVPLWMADRMSRKSKGMFDWNWSDSLVIGLSQMLLLVPGGGRALGSLSGGLFRNYNREATAKFSFYAAGPLLAAATFIHLRGLNLHDASPMADLSWLSFGVALAITTLTSLLVIGGFMKHIQQKSFNQYLVYRFMLAIGAGVIFWLRSH